MLFSSLLRGIATIAFAASTVSAAALTQITTNFGSNPTGAGFYLYKPDKLAANPPIIVAIHYCGGTAQAYYTGTQYAQLADQYGFIVIYPNAPTAGGCWDVATNATLTHNAGGDSLGIASMVRYTISTYGADASRMFVTGTSSGAMMTNVLCGAYPDMFKAATWYSGVPYSCFAGPTAWNEQCSEGHLIKTGQQWGDLVRSGYPGYTGPRPKMIAFHGTTDNVLYYQNLVEMNKQWPNVLGLSFTANTTNDPFTGYTKMTFGDGTKYIAYSAAGVGHTVPVDAAIDLAWFGITGGSPTTPPPATTLKTMTVAPMNTAPASGGTVAKYGQCGGIGWTGGTACAAGSTCKVSNAYYSQCL